jgi:hypothetical protein
VRILPLVTPRKNMCLEAGPNGLRPAKRSEVRMAGPHPRGNLRSPAAGSNWGVERFYWGVGGAFGGRGGEKGDVKVLGVCGGRQLGGRRPFCHP